MRIRIALLVAALAGLAAALAGPATAPAASARTGGAGYVVAMRPATPEGVADRVAARVGVTVRDHYHGANAGISARMTEAEARRMRAQPEVLFVQPDGPVTAAGKPAGGGGGGGGTAPETVPPGVRRIEAARAASGVAVAVVDTGIAATGELDVGGGTNCVSPGSAAVDDNGHGTHVAGIIGARANGAGTVGAAPDTRLYAVKVLNARKSGTLSQLLCGLDWVAANAAALNIGVVNLSLAAKGGDDGSCGDVNGDALHRAVCALTAAGVVVVAAAGNSTAALEQTVPAAYSESLSVTAMADTDGLAGGIGKAPCGRTDADDRYAAVSNFATTSAAQAHTLAAPGVCVTSTGLTSATAVYTGTSQAAPHAAAAAALCVDEGGAAGPCAGLTPAGVVARLRADARSGAAGFVGDPLRSLTGRYYGPLVSAASY